MGVPLALRLRCADIPGSRQAGDQDSDAQPFNGRERRMPRPTVEARPVVQSSRKCRGFRSLQRGTSPWRPWSTLPCPWCTPHFEAFHLFLESTRTNKPLWKGNCGHGPPSHALLAAWLAVTECRGLSTRILGKKHFGGVSTMRGLFQSIVLHSMSALRMASRVGDVVIVRPCSSIC